jgi:hypothetical protein
LGEVAGLSGERVKTGYRYFVQKNLCRESQRIAIRSVRDEPMVVEILESLPGTNWEITASSHPYEVLADTAQLLFRVSVPAQGEVEVTYTVEYIP